MKSVVLCASQVQLEHSALIAAHRALQSQLESQAARTSEAEAVAAAAKRELQQVCVWNPQRHDPR